MRGEVSGTRMVLVVVLLDADSVQASLYTVPKHYDSCTSSCEASLLHAVQL